MKQAHKLSNSASLTIHHAADCASNILHRNNHADAPAAKPHKPRRGRNVADHHSQIRKAAAKYALEMVKDPTPQPPRTVKEAFWDAIFEVTPFALSICFLFVPSVSREIFRARSCVAFGYDDAASGDSQHYYLRADLSIRCYAGGEHDRLLGIMWVFAAIWPIGSVLLFIGLLIPCRGPIGRGESTALTRATAFLTSEYEESVFFWEPVDLVRRTVLTGWVLMIDERYVFLRLFVALLVSLAGFTAILAVKPFKRADDDLLAVATQMGLVLTFIGGLALHAFRSYTRDAGLAAAIAAMGFKSEEQIVYLLVIVLFSMLLLLAVVIVLEAYKAHKAEKEASRWSSSLSHAPQLNWRAEGDYACFLSHYKAEAASDCRYLHDVLSRMLKTPIYYDSSTLADLRTLFTNGVHLSDTIVLIATRGVLTRPWCVLELLEAFRQQVPVIPVGLTGKTWDVPEMRTYVEEFEGRMTASGLKLIREHLGTEDLSELKYVLHSVLDKWEDPLTPQLEWNPNVGDNQMVANLKDVVERMCQATGRTPEWNDSTEVDDSTYIVDHYFKPCLRWLHIIKPEASEKNVAAVTLQSANSGAFPTAVRPEPSLQRELAWHGPHWA